MSFFRTFHFRTTTRKDLSKFCLLEMLLLQNANASDTVIITADTRHTHRVSERDVDPKLCKVDLDFFSNCVVTLENLRPWAYARTPGIPRNVDVFSS